MHTEAGYRFTGDDGIYALTYPEMGLLHDGYTVMQEQQEMDEHGVDQHTQAEFKDFAQQVNSSPGGAADVIS